MVEPWHERYIPEPNSGCWLWLGAAHQDGYGCIYLSKAKVVPSHRMFYERHRGPIPSGLFVLHQCDTRLCCNPDHLFLGTQADNMADKVRKGRCQDQRGEKAPGSVLTRSDVDKIRASSKSQREMAKEFGVSQSHISRIRSRDRDVWR